MNTIPLGYRCWRHHHHKASEQKCKGRAQSRVAGRSTQACALRAPLAVRADGRGFKKILESRKKPYDIDFARSMVASVESFFLDFGVTPALAYTFSDEISLIFLEAPFAGRVEKIDSLVAGFLSAALSHNMGRVVSMDCRIISLGSSEIHRLSF